MSYAHMPLQDRRDPNLDGSGSVCPLIRLMNHFTHHLSLLQTSFHQNGLGQALGNHLAAGVGHAPTYSRNDFRNPSTSPPTLNQPGSSNHAGTSSSHSTFAVQAPVTSPAMKRKQVDGTQNVQTIKRRRETGGPGGDEGDGYDLDGGAQGAKHWTDEEKSKLFSWLMGPGQEEHWNSLRATKNSCLRDVRSPTYTCTAISCLNGDNLI